MTSTIVRPRHLGEPPLHAPNAALLIDFDNVTLGIRSDLTKELKALLNSEIIKGKVAVSRAYADWRRYPQYIVPLSESSIDLIFAPAFGTNKKNATDIRLAIDAIELVFTRPEIGTFILLSGDSDFSTMVIKLKEYGKYVIGVGIRESASDLLIQNCDEYYSYSDLAGLTREADAPSTQRDPWELVVEAVEQMARNSDVMRSDRLKQVMQQIDPNFDERNAGYNRFSKFIVEAGSKGLLGVSKMENGQYEVAALPRGAARRAVTPPPAAPAVASPVPPAAREREKEDDTASRVRRGRSRGGRGRGRGEREDREVREERASAPAPAATPAPSPAPMVAPARSSGLTLAQAFDLLQQALAELAHPAGQEGLRLRMVSLRGREDPLLEVGRFARLLRQAHDAEIVDVRKLDDDSYEVSPRGVLPPPRPRPAIVPDAEEVPEPEAVKEDNGRRPALRFRRGSRGSGMPSAMPMVGVVRLDEDEAPGKEPQVVGLEAAIDVDAPVVEQVVAEGDQPARPRRRARGGRGRGGTASKAAGAETGEKKPAAGGRGKRKPE